MKDNRVNTMIRFDADVHEALKETAQAMELSVNWLANRLVREGLLNMDLDVSFRQKLVAR